MRDALASGAATHGRYEPDRVPWLRGAGAPSDGPTHRYISASPACWAICTTFGAGEPPVAPSPLRELLVDAYAPHPGVPSDQAIQSVAVHLITLYGVLVTATRLAMRSPLEPGRYASRPAPGVPGSAGSPRPISRAP
jgi:hypothetical protein